MESARTFPKLAGFILLLVTPASTVINHPCPLGQIAHKDQGLTRCCLPVDCDPNFYLQFCFWNGTEDTCEACPQGSKLFKRTSSFAVENCTPFPLGDDCKPTPGSLTPTLADLQNCHCFPETGWYYHPPESTFVGATQCQPYIPHCGPGKQPNQQGLCEPCPRGTVQDTNNSVLLCRPQRDCSRLGLKVLTPGNAAVKEVCDNPPIPPPQKPLNSTSKSTLTDLTTTTSTAVSATTADGSGEPAVKPSTNMDDATSPLYLIAVLVGVGIVAVSCVVVLFFIGRRRGWCQQRGQDVESNGHASELAMSAQQHDNDNSSNNSCCACADSCLSTSSKPSCSTSGKLGATSSNGLKQPLPTLDANWNGQYINGKIGSESPGHGYSEPLYNSISHDGSKMSDGNMATYRNVKEGPLPATVMLTQEDFYNYPTKVHLPSSDDDDTDSLKKLKASGDTQQEVVSSAADKDSEDFKETDPLLPTEDVSLRRTTPMVLTVASSSGSMQISAGNRPHLSILLPSVDDNPSRSENSHAQNLPCLSQLVSVSTLHSEPGVQVSERQQQLQQQLLLHQMQEGSTLTARMVPGVVHTMHPELTHNAVTMEELKPIIPLNSNPPAMGSEGGSARGHAGGGSPARIKPSRQEEVPRKGARESTPLRGAQAAPPADLTDIKTVPGRTPMNREPEETLRKEVLEMASPDGGEDETGRKSVGGSSGLGESLDFSSPLSLQSDDGRRGRTPYRRSVSEVSRSVSPSPVPLPRSISSPEEKHRTVAVVKPMQSDQSLNHLQSSHDRLADLMQPLDGAGRSHPLLRARGHGLRREPSQDSSTDDPNATRPKTPDRLSEEEDESENSDNSDTNERTCANFYGDNDTEYRDSRDRDSGRKDKSTDRGSDG